MSVPHRMLALVLALLIAPSTASLRAASGDSKPAPDPAMAAAHAAAKGDGLLEALLTELDRSKAQLKMDQVQPPYFIEYRVNEVEDYTAEAAFGALRENQHAHYRVLRVVVRIGNYKQDSFYNQGMGETTILPLDDDPIAIRHQIWLATDAAYKAAGLDIPRTAQAQYNAGPLLPAGTSLEPGDLVFFGTPAHIHHVGISLGGTTIIDAPSPGQPVKAHDLRDYPDYAGASNPTRS